MEENDEFVACAEVIAVGPKCENVKVGEDVFVIKHIANPCPFRKMGYLCNIRVKYPLSSFP